MVYTLQQIADWVQGTVVGDPQITVSGVTGIDNAGPDDLTFAVSKQHLEKAAKSKAAAVLVAEPQQDFPKPLIVTTDAKVAFATLLNKLAPPLNVAEGIHSTCVLGNNVTLGAHVSLQPYVVVGDNVAIGDHCLIYPHVYIGDHVTIGDHVVIHANVSIREDSVIGDRVIIQNNAVIGSDGFGYVTIDGRHTRVPQVGHVVLEDDVEIGAQTAIDRATTGITKVARGTKIDNLVQLAHNVVVGEDCFICAQVGIAGSATVGNHCVLAGQTGSSGHLDIGDNCVFAAKSGIISSVPDQSFYAGFPARPHQQWLRAEAAIAKLPELMKKVRSLEKQLAVQTRGEHKHE